MDSSFGGSPKLPGCAIRFPPLTTRGLERSIVGRESMLNRSVPIDSPSYLMSDVSRCESDQATIALLRSAPRGIHRKHQFPNSSVVWNKVRESICSHGRTYRWLRLLSCVHGNSTLPARIGGFRPKRTQENRLRLEEHRKAVCRISRRAAEPRRTKDQAIC